MRSESLITAILVGGLVSAWTHGAGTVATNDLLIGAGGFLTGMSIGNDGTIVVRTDTYGAYKWCDASHSTACTYTTAPNGTAGTWQQMLTTKTMPATFAANGQFSSHGVFEIQVCYGTPATMYAVYDTYDSTGTQQSTVYKSTNGGAAWTATGFTPVALQPIDATYKNWGPKLGIDPSNCNNVIFGTMTSGATTTSLQYSTDGGATWNTVGTGQVPASNGNGYTGAIVNGNTAYIFSIGNGVYKTTGGFAGTWTHLTSGVGPTTVQLAALDTGTGDYYTVDTSHNLWVWNGSTWTETLATGGSDDNDVFSVAVDPSTSGHVIAISGHGDINETFNSGGAWSGWTAPGNITLSTTGDIPWMTSLGAGTVGAMGSFFDPSIAKKVYVNTQNGFWVTTPWSGNIGGATALTWNSQGRGIEQLVATAILAAPNYATPFTGSWDRPAFHPNLTNYPTAIAPVNNTTLSVGFSLDYDSTGGTSAVCVAADGSYVSNGINKSGCTTDGVTWTLFPNLPSTVYPTNTTVGAVTNVAMTSNTNLILATSGQQPQYTTNATAGTITWNGVTCPGVASWSNFINGNLFNGGYGTRVIAADRVTAGSYSMYVNGIGFFKLTGSGASCAAGAAVTSIPSGGAGFNASMQLQTVPGVASEFWIAVGQSGNPGIGQPPNLVSGLAYSVDGGTTITPVTNITAALAVGFGLHVNGQTHPAVYIVAWYRASITSQSFTIANSGQATVTVPAGLNLAIGGSVYFDAGSGNKQWGSVVSYNNSTGSMTFNLVNSAGSGTLSSWTFMAYGLWQCTVSCNASSTPAWTQIAGWPASSFDTPTAISGDPSIYNRVYVGFAGSGFQKFNFLLSRDIGPANDNTPMWLNEVA